MRNNHLVKILPVFLLVFLMLSVGSCIHIDGSGYWHRQVKHELVVELSGPMAGGGEFEAETHNGDVTVTGAEVSECSMTATITGRAENDEDAMRIAEETRVTLESSGKDMKAKIVKPNLGKRESVSVDLVVMVPNQTDLDLTTHNGDIGIENIEGDVAGLTYNGGFGITRITGDMNLHTHNGGFNCKEISGDLQLKTHNGEVTAIYADSAPPVCEVSIESHNGNLDLTPPANFSARADISTHNGKVSTDLPLTIRGSFGRKHITGTIGDGEGMLKMTTYNGSIKIR
jgi:DUF4097 and DUF4098 domain-containing protein YvlB